MLCRNAPYRIDNISAIDSPALLVFPEIVRKNIDNALGLVSDSHSTVIRPHVKTVKCREVIELSMAKGIDRFKCSTISEAELLGMAGAKDVLLCYQLSETKARRFEALRKKFPNTLFSALVDNRESANMLSDFFHVHPLTVYIDINVGMDRTGIKTNEAFEFITSINDLLGLNICGLHVYDGHVHSPDRDTREQQSETIFSEVSCFAETGGKPFRKKVEIGHRRLTFVSLLCETRRG